MFLSYTVSNYKSIKEPVTLSFIADKGSEFADTNTFPIDKNGAKGLKSLFLFGANASGKSNILESFYAFNVALRYGSYLGPTNGDTQEYWNVTPYLFDDDYRREPTIFDVEVSIAEFKYLYHLEHTQEKLVCEELYRYDGKRKKRIFTVSEKGITFGTSVKKEEKEHLSKIASWTNNKTFLAAIAREKQKVLTEYNVVYYDLINILYIKYPQYTVSRAITAGYIGNVSNKKKVISMLRNADSCINDVIVTEDKTSKIGYDIKFEYLIKGKKEYINYNMESDGNRKLFDLAAILLVALESGLDTLLIIDELDNNLHPCIIDDLVDNYMQAKGHRQLLTSMHYTGLMNSLRRDQIVLVEKDKKELTTTVATMADFTGVRKDLDKEKAYLKGIFGATPFTSFDFNVKGGK